MTSSYLTLTPAQKRALDSGFFSAFGGEPARYFSAPGRTEIGGNHTDHQRGRVLAAAVNLDTQAAGMNGHIPKPFDVKKLLAELNRFL